MKTVQLSFPVKIDGIEFKELEFRRPKGRDIQEMQSRKMHEQDVFMLSRLSQKPEELFLEMDAADYLACKEVITGFLSRGS